MNTDLKWGVRSLSKRVRMKTVYNSESLSFCKESHFRPIIPKEGETVQEDLTMHAVLVEMIEEVRLLTLVDTKEKQVKMLNELRIQQHYAHHHHDIVAIIMIVAIITWPACSLDQGAS